MKLTGQLVDDKFPSAKIMAFKKLCFDEGDYTRKDGKEETLFKKKGGLGR